MLTQPSRSYVWQYIYRNAFWWQVPVPCRMDATRVVGACFGLSRRTGEPLWRVQPNYLRCNVETVAIADQVFVATRYVPDPATGRRADLYRFDLDSGEFLYPVRALSIRGRWEHFLDIRLDRSVISSGAAPLAVDGEEAILTSGEIVDLASGWCTGRMRLTRAEIRELMSRMYRRKGPHLARRSSLIVPGIGRLVPDLPGGAARGSTFAPCWPFVFHLRNADGGVVWVHDASAIRSGGWFGDLNDLWTIPPYLIYLVKNRRTRQYRQADMTPSAFVWLCALDLRDGRIVHYAPVHYDPVHDGTILDADTDGVVVSYRSLEQSETFVQYYAIGADAHSPAASPASPL